jgi:hypothetical protein
MKFFIDAFRHHVMRKVTGVDMYEDPQGASHNYAKFDELSQNPVLLQEAVEKTLDEMKGLDSVKLALMSYGIEKKELNFSLERIYLSYRAKIDMCSKRHQSKVFTETVKNSNASEYSSSPKP